MEPINRDDEQPNPPQASGLYNESYRPQFHFSARRNWLNDPNGLIYYKGEYHLFFQHNPTGLEWGDMTWGHAISKDLLHWQQLPSALIPDALGTMFSGSAVVDWNNTTGLQSGREKPLIALYTAAGGTSPDSQGQPFTQCLAYSTDRGRTWTKYARNPVLKHIVGTNRDPKVIWHEPTHRWIMALYLDKNDFGLFASPDLKNWTHLHNLTLPGCDECPDFFPLVVEGDTDIIKWVFTAANGHYIVGDFDGQKFTPQDDAQPSDWGANFYAVQTYSDIPIGDGRRIQIAWMRGGQYPDMPFNQQMSFPCTLTLRHAPEGWRLYRWPVRELASLYTRNQRWQNLTLQPGKNPLSGLNGDLWDIEAEFELKNAAEFGLRARGEAVRYRVSDATLTCLGRSVPLEPEANRVKLRLLVDRSSLEVFGNEGKVSLTSCFLPKIEEQEIGVFTDGGTVKVISLKVRPLKSAVQ